MVQWMKLFKHKSHLNRPVHQWPGSASTDEAPLFEYQNLVAQRLDFIPIVRDVKHGQSEFVPDASQVRNDF